MVTPHKPVTLSFLAKRLNVHVSTVSRVLNGKADDAKSAASPDTVARIRALADELNYRPNLHAIGLRTHKSRSVGVLVPRLSDLSIATIYEGVEAAAADHGYLSFVSNTGDSAGRQRELAEMALDRGVEGIIFADARLDDVRFIDELALRGTPLLLVSRHAGRHCAVTCDDVCGGGLAARHLLALGHRDFAILAGERYSSTGYDRSQGFIQACHEQGVEIPSDRVLFGSFRAETGYEFGRRLFSRKTRPTAVFTANDFLAIGLMGAVRDCGLIPGQDIAVVGFNDTPIAAHLPIGLSSVRSPRHRMGYRAFELLLARIAGETPLTEQLEPQLIVRASSALDIRAR
ncbi:LacI family DNA-binding transcriptional regulator [Castellaniella sp.]|uniref:LacI family DNA-binding transcriptional regulator n=1 Tax=Castellaniella sp. TaxID=1955812 RepID=UPI002AFF784C|nr:LacI family DNA-binding transcriptional regulator [Castellaniella sp.]